MPAVVCQWQMLAGCVVAGKGTGRSPGTDNQRLDPARHQQHQASVEGQISPGANSLGSVKTHVTSICMPIVAS
jgi:hypothetical protein